MEAENQNSNGKSFLKGIEGGLILACFLLLMDGVSGSFMFSVLVGPVWFLVGIGKAIMRRSNWRFALARILLPVVTIGLTSGNTSLQRNIARHNASEIIEACEHYRAVTGEYPERLEDLVPAYLHSIPRAKYALGMSTFQYFPGPNSHRLYWFDLPFISHIYDFEKAQWISLD
jgi:hypothetical protein